MKERLGLIRYERPFATERKVSKERGMECLGKAHEVFFQKHGGADARVGANHQ